MTKKTSIPGSFKQAFDPSVYTRPPVLNIASAVALGNALVKQCPKDAPAGIKKSAKALKLATKEAMATWAARQDQDSATPTIGGDDKRLLDLRNDHGVSALRMCLAAHAQLPEEFEKAGRAQALLQRLFKDGLEFLNLPYAEELATIETLMKRIEDGKLDKQIDAVCGPDFLANIRKNLVRYRAMVRADKPVTADLSLIDAVRAVGAAVVDHAIAVCATVDRADAESIRWARELLRPIDDLREQQQQQLRGTPATPPPEPPPASPAS